MRWTACPSAPRPRRRPSSTSIRNSVISVSAEYCEPQCCGTETIYSGSGFDFGKVSIPILVLVPDPYPDPVII